MGALFCGDLFSRHFYSHGNIVDLRFSGINPNDSYTMLNGLNNFDERNKREIIDYPGDKFSSNISYYIGSANLTTNVTIAVEKIQNQTCINFKKVDNRSDLFNNTDGNALLFRYSDSCYAVFGKDGNKKKSFVNITNDCDSPYEIQLLLASALGVNYEHLRLDRNDYIKMQWQNIDNETRYFFKNRGYENFSKSLNVSYNFGSGFHLGAYTYSKEGRRAFKLYDKKYYDTLGQKSLDFSDYKLLNNYYCNDTCSEKLECQNSGYTDPKNCKKCRCPLFYEGTKCEKLRNSSENCLTPKEIKLSDNNTFFRLGDEGNKTCYTRIEAPENKTVEIFLAAVTYNVDGERIYLRCRPKQSLQVKYYKDKGPMGALFCGELYGHHFHSHSNIVDLRFSGINDDDAYTMLVRTSNKSYLTRKEKKKAKKKKEKKQKKTNKQ
uniref:Metalloendopeptidase n=1 Tax=Parastrongyloides trichosuri TaxID=131310 RepID=A0A0N4Z5I2_PARTI